MERPKISYIPKGLKVDYTEEYGRLLKQEVEFTPTCQDDFLYQRRLIERWYKKSVPQLIVMGRPDAAYGVSMALCKAIPQLYSVRTSTLCLIRKSHNYGSWLSGLSRGWWNR